MTAFISRAVLVILLVSGCRVVAKEPIEGSLECSDVFLAKFETEKSVRLPLKIRIKNNGTSGAQIQLPIIVNKDVYKLYLNPWIDIFDDTGVKKDVYVDLLNPSVVSHLLLPPRAELEAFLSNNVYVKIQKPGRYIIKVAINVSDTQGIDRELIIEKPIHISVTSTGSEG